MAHRSGADARAAFASRRRRCYLARGLAWSKPSVGAALPLPVVLFPLAIDEGSVRDIPGSSAFQVADGSCCPGFVESCAGGRTTWKLQRMEGMAVHYKAGTQGRLPQSETGTPSPGRSTVGRLAIRPFRAVLTHRPTGGASPDKNSATIHLRVFVSYFVSFFSDFSPSLESCQYLPRLIIFDSPCRSM